MNTNYENGKNREYKKKYHYAKRYVKNLIIENAALCDEVSKTQESINIVKEERKFLLRKLLEYENTSEIPVICNTKSKKRKSPEQNGKNIPVP